MYLRNHCTIIASVNWSICRLIKYADYHGQSPSFLRKKCPKERQALSEPTGIYFTEVIGWGCFVLKIIIHRLQPCRLLRWRTVRWCLPAYSRCHPSPSRLPLQPLLQPPGVQKYKCRSCQKRRPLCTAVMSKIIWKYRLSSFSKKGVFSGLKTIIRVGIFKKSFENIIIFECMSNLVCTVHTCKRFY